MTDYLPPFLSQSMSSLGLRPTPQLDAVFTNRTLLTGARSKVVRHGDYRDGKQTVTGYADRKIEATLSLSPIVDPSEEHDG